jgi:hypothetical protein
LQEKNGYLKDKINEPETSGKSKNIRHLYLNLTSDTNLVLNREIMRMLIYMLSPSIY